MPDAQLCAAAKWERVNVDGCSFSCARFQVRERIHFCSSLVMAGGGDLTIDVGDGEERRPDHTSSRVLLLSISRCPALAYDLFAARNSRMTMRSAEDFGVDDGFDNERDDHTFQYAEGMPCCAEKHFLLCGRYAVLCSVEWRQLRRFPVRARGLKAGWRCVHRQCFRIECKVR